MALSSARSITVIPANAPRFSVNPTFQNVKKRVAAYARVSTDNEEQLTSYEAQVDYYTRHIHDNADWEFVGVYTDEGISGTSTKNREGFNRMIQDALDGKIDLILTKSVSRFARNTVDTLTTVRRLKEKGVEVFFEKENIYTLDSKGELLITIMSSLAQEESRSISENVRWGKRKSFADGKVSLPYKQFLGYEKGIDGRPKIVEEEAKIIRMIYKLFLEGMTPSAIAVYLTKRGIPTPAKKIAWHYSTVLSILGNEKYCGEAILQKAFTVDFLTKKTKKNEGEIPQYIVENSHIGVISKELFDLVQQEMKKRKGKNHHKTCVNCFSGKVVCGECGGYFGSKLWHSTSAYRRTVWQCNNKFKNQTKCSTPHMYESRIRQAFVEAFNRILSNKTEILEGYEAIIEQLTNTAALEAERRKVEAEMAGIVDNIENSVHTNASTMLDQGEYLMEYNQYTAQYHEAKQRRAEINEQIGNRKARKNQIKAYIRTLDARQGLLEEFDESLFAATVDNIVVKSDTELVFQWKDGSELPWKIAPKK